MRQGDGSGHANVARSEAFVRGEATLTVLSEQGYDDVAAQLESSFTANRLAVAHVHEFGAEFAAVAASAGDADRRCRVYEIVDRQLARELLAFDLNLAHLLPWRVVLHEQHGAATVTTPMPTVAMTEFSHAAEVAKIAKRFEASLSRVLRSLR